MSSTKLLKCFYPHNLVIVTVAVSAAAWATPDIEGLRHGFYVRETPTLVGMAVLAAWYGSIVLMAALGFTLGRRSGNTARYRVAVPFQKPLTYRLFLVLAIVGIVATYYRVAQSLGLGGMLQSISRNTMNDLKSALYQNYSIGVFSLRYLAAICGGIGMWRILNRSRSLVDFTAILCWIATAAITGRLSILWGTMTAITLWLAGIERVSFRTFAKFIGVGATALMLLWILNYSRNANYYRAHGVDSFGMAGLSEAVAYLGSPFQVSLGVANHIGQALDGTPSAELVEWDHGLNADSAFENLVQNMSYWALPYILVTVFGYSLLSGFCFRMRGTWLFLGFPIIGYAFAEIWRLDFFRQGIFYTNTVVGLSVPVILARASGLLRTSRGWTGRHGTGVATA